MAALTAPRKLRIARKYVAARRCIVPEIAFSGDWLKKLGFMPGFGIQVTVEYGRLVIEPQ